MPDHRPLPRACRFAEVSARVDRFTPDATTDRPVLGAVRGTAGTLLVDGGASPSHLAAFTAELAARGRPPVVAVALTHWHWDHSFGSAAVDAPVIASRGTADGLAVQRGHAWDDAALEQRVRDGQELAFSLPHIRAELPDRRELEIVLPTTVFDDVHRVDLGDVAVELRHVGGDHAADSVVVWVPDDRVLFVGDAFYPCLWGDPPYLTIAGTRALVERLADLAPLHALEGHDEDVADAAGWAARMAELTTACDLVATHGAVAAAMTGGDEGLAEVVGVLLAGEGLA